MVEFPELALLVAVTIVVPDATPVIRPPGEVTVNVETLPEVQVVVVPQQEVVQSAVAPSLTLPMACIWRVPPTETEPGFGVTTMLEMVFSLVTVMVEALLA
jgi:hypothetical protein